jgi:hypothetical protein
MPWKTIPTLIREHHIQFIFQAWTFFRLLAAVDCVPLAVALMANLAETDSTETLLLRWREEHSSLLHRTPDRRASLDVSIALSLNSSRIRAVPEVGGTRFFPGLTKHF